MILCLKLPENAGKLSRGKNMTVKIMFRCPYCNREFTTYWGLVIHCRARHITSTCPVCGEQFKRMEIHLERASHYCDEHKVAYALLRCSRKKRHSDHLVACRDFAMEYCKVEVVVEDA